MFSRKRTDPPGAGLKMKTTGEAARMAEEAQNLALSLYRHIVYGEALTDD